MPDPVWGALVRASAPFRLGLVVITGAAAAAGAIILFGAGIGLGTVVGVVVVVAAMYLLGRVIEAQRRSELEHEAFEWLAPAGDANPIHDFYVRQWRPRISEDLPDFVERDVMSDVTEGLESERFVILKGPSFSGKSRIVLEAMLKMERMVLIARPSPADPAGDPLLKLMRDPRGFASSSQRQVLVLRDCQERLLSGSIDGDFMRTWLDAHPNISVIATLSTADVRKIRAAGSTKEEELRKLEAEALVVPVSAELSEPEMKIARATFRELQEDELRRLPAYLCSGELLEERFKEASGGHGLAQAIVRAAADWERAGIARAAPRRYLEHACWRYLGDRSEDFGTELEWALERIEGAASLLYEVEGGFVVDGTVRDMLDSGEALPGQGGELPDFAWEEVQGELRRAAASPGVAEVDLVDDLVGLERSATERGHAGVADWALAQALQQDAGPRRINQHFVAAPKAGPPPQLMRVRDGDTVLRRLTAIVKLVEAKNQRAIRRRSSSSSVGDELLVSIYAYGALRALFRLLTLFLADAASVCLGLGVGLALRAWVGDLSFSDSLATFSHTVVPMLAGVVVVFGVLSLYKQDAPRAHLSRILSATMMLGFVALVTSLVKDFDPLADLSGAAIGIVTAAWADYRLRVLYDKYSRDWVIRHELEVWLLVIGNAAQFKAAKRAMDDTTRPTEVVGYLSTDPDDVEKGDDEDCLGAVGQLSGVLSRHDIERVLIADPEMPAEVRQDLADICHTRGLPVEAVPSLADIQMGDCEFVAGSSLVLMALEPLWQRNVGFFVKRAFDWTIAAVGLILLSPFLLSIAAAIKVFDGHSPMTREWRVGLAGKVFGMHRFRTTTEDPEASDPRTVDTDLFTMGTTRLGKFLCSRGWDELPQLLNVLRGEMSLTGPRPLYIRDHIKLSKRHLRRYVVRPGMTGPWQVCKRPNFSTDELTRLEVAYLRNWSFITDLDLIVKAARIGIRGRKNFGKLD